MNTFGHNYRLTDFGESHGKAYGGVIDGMPHGFRIDMGQLSRFMARRAPGQSLTTPRKEPDAVEFLSGMSEDNVTYGTPIGFIVPNRDYRSGDYAEMQHKFRPNHADYTYYRKYEGHMAWAGGGRASARQTVCRVVAGGLAMQWLESQGVRIESKLLSPRQEEIEAALRNADSIGGLVECTVTGVPVGIGDPVYGKLSARLADAMLGINAVKGFDYGDGFEAARMHGSECQDIFLEDFTTITNHSGGIQGGISNGMPIVFRVWFKPTPTIGRECQTVDTDGRSVMLEMKGRHDPCVAVRGQVVVEAMAAMVLADFMMK